MSRSVWFVSMLAAVGSLFAGCGKSQVDVTPEPVAEVTTETAVTKDLLIVTKGYGVIEFNPTGQRTLTSELEASVLELTAVPGDSVKQGDTVLRLIPSSSTEVDVARARRDANAAQSVAARTKRLRKGGLASDADVEASVVVASDLEALAESLESRMGSIRTIQSPIDGVVDAILVEPGGIIAPGTALARIASPGSIQARIGIEVEDVGGLTIGGAVQIESHDRSATTLHSTIRMIDQRVDPTTRMTSIYVLIPAGSGLLAGQAVRAELTADIKKGAVVVPRQSVFADELGKYIFIEINGRAALRRVTTGVTVSDQTEIVSGAVVGDIIVVDGAAILADGVKIRTPSDSTENT